MSQTSDRIPCPRCQANNFPSSDVCWQCGQPLHQQQDQPPAQPPPEPGPPQPPGGYQPSPPYTPQKPADTGQIYVILGFVSAAVGLLCCPFIFSVAAIIMGVIARNKGNPLGVWVIAAGVASLVIGVIVGAIIGALNWAQFYKPHSSTSPGSIPSWP